MLKLLKVLLLLVHLVGAAEVSDEVEDTNPGSCSKDGPSDSCDSAKDEKKGAKAEEEEDVFDASDMYAGALNIVTLDDDNFDQTVLNSDAVWLIKVYSPTCGHCKAMHADWVKAAKQLNNVVKFGAINDVVAYELSKKFQFRSVPKILYYKKKTTEVTDYALYNGPRDTASFVKFALDSLYAEFKPLMK